MRRAVEDALILRSPCRSIELPQVIAAEKRYLTEDEVERLVAAVEPRYKALVYTAAYLGLRWQEIAGLRKKALDIRPGRLASMRVVTTIERAGGRYRAVEYGKSKAARHKLKMPEFLREILVWHLKAFQKRRVRVPRARRRLSALRQLPAPGVEPLRYLRAPVPRPGGGPRGRPGRPQAPGPRRSC
jgi:hypothetical protein